MNSSTSKFLEGELVYLRQLEPDDAEYYQWFNDAEVCAGNSHHIFPMTRADALEYIEALRHRNDILALAIISNKNDQHIGNISLQDIHHWYRSADLALIIGDKSYWGKGYGTEACRLIIRHAFSAMNLRRITCGTFSNNAGMIGIAEALGMVQEGVRVQAAYKDGVWLDIIEYGMLK